MSHCIRQNIAKIKEDIHLVVGVPRSGVVPAYMIALYKNIMACSLDEFISGHYGSSGITRKLKQIDKITNVLIVDDSIKHGKSLVLVKEKIKKAKLDKKFNIKYLCIYTADTAVDLVDYYFEIVPVPRMYQWNYLNIRYNENSCFDIDGVLCVDPTEEENDDGEKYIEFLRNAKPLFIPEFTIHTLVTSRLEKYRAETELWLKKHNVKYNNLVMLNLNSKEERKRQNAHAKFKAEVYAKSDTILFVESNPKQAEEIARLTGKQCMCVGNDKLYN